jgi:hypothetical protein
VTPELRALVEDLRRLDPELGTLERSRIARAMRRGWARGMAVRAFAVAALVALAALVWLRPAATAPEPGNALASLAPTCAPSERDERLALIASRVARSAPPEPARLPSMGFDARTWRDPRPNRSRLDARHGPIRPL